MLYEGKKKRSAILKCCSCVPLLGGTSFTKSGDVFFLLMTELQVNREIRKRKKERKKWNLIQNC